MRPLIRFLATFGYTGLIPKAPGTAGSVAAAAIYLLLPRMSLTLFTVTVGTVLVLAVWSSGEMEKWYGHDAQIIVIDEVAGFLVAVAFLPKTFAVVFLGLLLFRVLDVIKPFPANASQRWPGGWGVVMDDVFAGVYANLLVRVVLWLF
jgi:phosphatidylglycerophosphatase A